MVGDAPLPFSFAHGPDRRNSQVPRDPERRKGERRRPDLAWIPLFKDADPAAVAASLGDCEVLALPPGGVLLRQGQTNDRVYIVLSGQIVAHLDADLNPLYAIPISLGACLGELSVIDRKPVSATVMAVAESRVLVLPNDIFWKRMMALPGVAINLMGTITERMRRTNEVALRTQREQLELTHLRKELDVARQLQASMLPLQRPLFPDRREIEVCGFMEPASNVGGDLFDAFFLDDRHLYFCIGDVSGHGVAAALFMARTIGLMRIIAMSTLEPHHIVSTLNDRLCAGNETNLFVTLFCGVLDVASGRLRYSNAGHCAPIRRAGGRAGMIETPRGPLIGVFPGVAYGCMELHLNPGELIFCYTDGVTEAKNPSEEEYSEERCARLVEAAGAEPLPDLLDIVRREVTTFTATPVLEDDCTMLAVRRPAQ